MAMMNTDPLTVESLQSRIPTLSKSDLVYIQEHMQSGQLFPEIKDPIQRSNIVRRLLTIKDIIPTLYTLIRDIRYLKRPAKILNVLLPKCRKATIRRRFYFYFTGAEETNDTIEVERSVASYMSIPRGNLEPFEIAYQQLWLCAARVYNNSNAYGLQQLATLAQRLGFSTSEIERELSKEPCQSVIEKVLREVLQVLRPNESFTLDVGQARPLMASFNDFLARILEAPVREPAAMITIAGPGEPLSRRCGYSNMDDQDLDLLFLPSIHAPLQESQMLGGEISSFYVKRSRHRAFFGAVDLSENRQHLSPEPSLPGPPIEQRRRSPPIPNPTFTTSEQDVSTYGSAQGVVIYQPETQMVIFKEDGKADCKVPYNEEQVNEQAEQYANDGKKLFIEGGPHFIWSDCFAILNKVGKSVVFVTTILEPLNGKRR